MGCPFAHNIVRIGGSKEATTLSFATGASTLLLFALGLHGHGRENFCKVGGLHEGWPSSCLCARDQSGSATKSASTSREIQHCE
jgi:hypothetical protein